MYFFNFFFSAPAVVANEPSFVEQIQNVTVTAGRDVKLTCVVENLGTYKVSYINGGIINPFSHSGHCIGQPSKISILV